MEILDMIFKGLIFGLVLLFAASFTLFIRRLLINSSHKRNALLRIENKLEEFDIKLNSLAEQIEKSNRQ